MNENGLQKQRALWLILSSVDLHPIKDEDKNMEGLYWGVDYPWPMYDRDVSSPPLLIARLGLYKNL